MRFGAIGQKGSIALVERFIRSLKDECLRTARLLPLRRVAMQHELDAYRDWYAAHRPHRGLGGATPLEVSSGLTPAADPSKPRFEPRARWRTAGVALRAPPGTHLVAKVTPFRGRARLPVVALRQAA